VATAIHFYEAVLASLAIVVWHFYQVFFDPDVYPMNWTWWDGKMSFEHYRNEHALDSETLLQAARSDAAADQVAPAAVPAKGQGGTSVEKTTTTADSPPNEEEVVSERRS
jgi:hypothetical protein